MMLTKNKQSSAGFTALEKDNLMFIIIIGLWIISLLYFDPKILTYLHRNTSVISRVSVGAFIVCVNVFWLFGIYHLVIAFFSAFIYRPRNALPQIPVDQSPRAAVLYLTMNDFKEEAALSCLNQDYSAFDVYILDDSTDKEWQSKVDKFISMHKQAKLIRRQKREHFKAGNLNHALERIHAGYEYFAVSDSDGILPEDFLKKLIPFFALDKKIGFVQANQRWNLKQDSEFAKDLGMNTDVHWKYYVPAKDKYGFLMFYGHGAVIRSEAWKEAGGFPHSITEDIVFSSLLREKGYYGIFISDVVCLEDFPQDYKSFRIRNERWLKGTTEYLYKWYPGLLCSNKVSWFEKLDVLISAGVLLQPFVFVLFLLLVSIILPLTAKFFGLHIPLVATFAPLAEVVAAYLSGMYIHTSWTMDFFLIMLVSAFAQFSALMWSIIKDPIKVTRYMGSFLFLCLSSSMASFVNILTIIITGKSRFLVTGVKEKKDTMEHKIIYCFEITLCAFLIFSTFTTGNLWLITVAISVLLNPFVYKAKWDDPVLSAAIYLPFILILAIVLMIAVLLV
ncbi:MAG: glycosyltransferase [Candidatus Omnitrophica bacterium]|nr:glycosyltransferase [Candidatus Omnitrophota bacterium]